MFIMQDGWDCLRGSLVCIWLVLFAEEDEIGMEDWLRKGKKWDGSMVKGIEYHPAKLFLSLIKNSCTNLSDFSWVVINCAFVIFWAWPEIMGSVQKCSAFMDLTQKCFEPLKCSVVHAGKSDSMPSTWTLKIHEYTWPLSLYLVPIK